MTDFVVKFCDWCHIAQPLDRADVAGLAAWNSDHDHGGDDE